MTRRRYVACRRNCITPAPTRRPTTPIAFRIAIPRNSEISDAIVPQVVSPRSNAGRIKWSVDQPSAQPSATVIAPYSMLASTDQREDARLLPDRDPQDREPSPGDAALVWELSATGKTHS